MLANSNLTPAFNNSTADGSVYSRMAHHGELRNFLNWLVEFGKTFHRQL